MNADFREDILAALDRIKERAQAATLLAEDLRVCPPKGSGPLRIIAIGKAARGMTASALEFLGSRVDSALCVGPSGMQSLRDARVKVMTGEHPVPGENSFQCGKETLAFAGSARRDGAAVMVLLSGGASSLCEWPDAGVSADEVMDVHRRQVAAGGSIESINAARGQISALKAGGLAETLGTSLVDLRVLVDVPSGDMEVVGSGPCVSSSFSGVKRAIATPEDLITMAEHEFEQVRVKRVRARSWDLRSLSEVMVEHAQYGQGLWVTAGEVSVRLPLEALGTREGGRAQHLALEVAMKLDASEPWAIVAWASDGRDGSAGCGALITSADRPRLQNDQAANALMTWQSGSYLDALGCRLNSFASETNLTDLYMVLRP